MTKKEGHTRCEPIPAPKLPALPSSVFQPSVSVRTTGSKRSSATIFLPDIEPIGSTTVTIYRPVALLPRRTSKAEG